ncbi:hypothetical protein L1987_30370 [Smallanthus sonchifolius]|uniref:Uncharacterized protein n=1 Tax=Smallanthus sonchifolius TaxID=185202 RepID=A0ACB9I419_9ASTR|nr:hypothetical protein L1987_30370 [Smallanthus sonchifolius]
MAGSSRELGFPRNSCVSSLREQVARTTLRNVRSKGHQYVELREDNKKPIFFCILCLSPCHSDSVLHDHLHGHLHKKMYEVAKSTLLKANPWPFNDGMLFFHIPSNDNDCLLTSKADLLEDVSIENNSLAIVTRERNHDCTSGDESVDVDGNGYHLIIPDVLHKDKLSDLEVKCIGVGQIGVRYFQKDGVTKGLSRIWCEWLGDNQYDIVPQHDFGIVSFAFDCDMGRKGVLDDMFLLPFCTREENITVSKGKKKRKSFSDPEDVSDILSNQYESCGEDGDNSLQLRSTGSRRVRKELRVHRRLASERVCDICQHKMLPGKDVATLVSMKTGRIVCSSRNINGAFHVFHISCLIHWVLFCEYEVSTKQLVGPKEKKQRGRKKGAAKGVEEVMKKQIYSPFCPECQGTGTEIDGDELEKPIVSLSEMFKYKMKACDGHREYMKCPEMLENCSTGFCFPPPQSDETLQELVSPVKMIRFFRADAD